MSTQASASLELARRWLAALAGADFAAWPSLVADDVRMRFPFAPPGMPAACEGRASCLTLIQAFFAGIASFTWEDLQLHPAEDDGLVFATARSRVLLLTGKRYGNEYCFMMRFREAKLAEYREYFNPLPAIAAFASPADSTSRLGS